MRLAYADYQKLLLELCRQKRRDPTSSSLLISATPANLKEECISVNKARGLIGAKGGEKILKDFFGTPTERRPLDTLIEICPPDRFKPLQNLINGKTKNPDVVTIELLAWLIDFRHRPYTHGMDVELSDAERAILHRPVGSVNGNVPDNHGSKFVSTKDESQIREGGIEKFDIVEKLISSLKKLKKRRVSIVAAFFLVLLLAAYLILQEQRVKQMALLNKNHGCMYWTGEQYEEMPCDQERGDRLKFPMDLEKMSSFKRITRLDTISERSIGKIYYIKINGAVEYYTAGGKHPIYVTRTLQQLSRYMYDKYLKNN